MALRRSSNPTAAAPDKALSVSMAVSISSYMLVLKLGTKPPPKNGITMSSILFKSIFCKAGYFCKSFTSSNPDKSFRFFNFSRTFLGNFFNVSFQPGFEKENPGGSLKGVPPPAAEKGLGAAMDAAKLGISPSFSFLIFTPYCFLNLERKAN